MQNRKVKASNRQIHQKDIYIIISIIYIYLACKALAFRRHKPCLSRPSVVALFRPIHFQGGGYYGRLSVFV